MTQENIIEAAYLPSGEMDIPFIFENAVLLLRENEYELAASLFRVAKDDKQLGYQAWFGLGQCYVAAQKYQNAVLVFEKALSLSKQPYIAVALVHSLISCKHFDIAEKKTVEYAREFAHDAASVSQLRKYYQLCLTQQVKRSTVRL
jgi:tetratricopeptide (TPR) repeat protein